MTAAEDNLEDAVKAAVASDGWSGLISGMMVLVAYVGNDGEGDQSGVLVLYPRGEESWPVALGLVEGARITLRSQFLSQPGDPPS